MGLLSRPTVRASRLSLKRWRPTWRTKRWPKLLSSSGPPAQQQGAAAAPVAAAALASNLEDDEVGKILKDAKLDTSKQATSDITRDWKLSDKGLSYNSLKILLGVVASLGLATSYQAKILKSIVMECIEMPVALILCVLARADTKAYSENNSTLSHADRWLQPPHL